MGAGKKGKRKEGRVDRSRKKMAESALLQKSEEALSEALVWLLPAPSHEPPGSRLGHSAVHCSMEGAGKSQHQAQLTHPHSHVTLGWAPEGTCVVSSLNRPTAVRCWDHSERKTVPSTCCSLSRAILRSMCSWAWDLPTELPTCTTLHGDQVYHQLGLPDLTRVSGCR